MQYWYNTYKGLPSKCRSDFLLQNKVWKINNEIIKSKIWIFLRIKNQKLGLEIPKPSFCKTFINHVISGTYLSEADKHALSYRQNADEDKWSEALLPIPDFPADLWYNRGFR